MSTFRTPAADQCITGVTAMPAHILFLKGCEAILFYVSIFTEMAIVHHFPSTLILIVQLHVCFIASVWILILNHKW